MIFPLLLDRLPERNAFLRDILSNRDRERERERGEERRERGIFAFLAGFGLIEES